jgi:DNA polymerase I-like protein with 3'-5' exonuclease and polymerase domains
MSTNTYLGRKAKTIIKIKKNPNNINYASDTQVVEIFARLQEPLLTKAETLVIPRFNKKGRIDKTYNTFVTGEKALESYKNMLPESIMVDFIDLLIKHRGYTKATSTYGMNFINNLNPVTGKLHTSFGQCFTDTGRMNSGGGKEEPDKPNFQNIPAKTDYAISMRNCFLADEGYSIGTHDLSGAELIIMCSLSQDMKLLEIARGDMHSYVAQGCWRAIYRYRAMKLSKKLAENTSVDVEGEKRLANLINLSLNYVVDSTKKAIRTAFKPMTFGTIYGMYAAKAAKTLNIIKEEGQIVIDWIRSQFPAVFRMVEAASEFAENHGYIIINERTKSRAWFPNIIKALKGEISAGDNFVTISKEKSEARNIRIQGTQADMIKEATVAIQSWIYKEGYSDEIILLSWIHDEIVDQHPKYLDGKSAEWCDYVNEQASNYTYPMTFNKDNPPILEYNNKWYSSFPEVKAQIMRDTCNKYLHNVTMDVDYHVEPYWTK